jgi:hypothetical protein
VKQFLFYTSYGAEKKGKTPMEWGFFEDVLNKSSHFRFFA